MAVLLPLNTDPVTHTLAQLLERWAPKLASSRLPAVDESIATLKDALAALGPDGDAGLRKKLQADLSRIEAALAAFEKLFERVGTDGATLRPEMDVPVITEFRAAQAAAEVAQAQFDNAEPEAIRAARDALDYAIAVRNKAGRAVDAAIDAAEYPRLPHLEAIAAAKADNEALLSAVSNRKQPAIALQLAISQGANTAPSQAMYWPLGLPEKPSEHLALCLKWRAKRASEPSAESLANEARHYQQLQRERELEAEEQAEAEAESLEKEARFYGMRVEDFVN